MRKRLILLLAALAAAPCALAEPPAAAQAEVRHLLGYLERSGCEFFRNGAWYSAPDARKHLEKKYDYLVRKDLVRSAEDFIRLGAASSSMSGKAYQVRCKGDAPVPSAAWLGSELARYRKAASR
jgi:hypothetical protein